MCESIDKVLISQSSTTPQSVLRTDSSPDKGSREKVRKTEVQIPGSANSEKMNLEKAIAFS